MASSPSATPLAEIPWIQAPPGVESNFGPDAPNKAIAILVVSIVMMVITTLVVTLRLTLNYIHAGRKLGWDDGTLSVLLLGPRRLHLTWSGLR